MKTYSDHKASINRSRQVFTLPLLKSFHQNIVTCPSSVTNINGFWIGRLNLLALLLHLHPIITAQNPWLPKSRSIPYWTTSVFSSNVTDLVMFSV
jgi:hypothetical protein